MRLKDFAKGIGMYFFTEALCLFLALTLSAIGGGIARLISCICTIGILLCLYGNYAYNRAVSDRKQKAPDSLSRKLFLSGAAVLPFLILGICLLLARGGVLPDGFYRWYKLLDAAFLQLCNFMSSDIAASALSWGKAVALALLNLLPFLTVWVVYTLVRKGVMLEELQYRRK